MRFVSPLALLIASLVSPPLAGAEINFNRDIRPLLSNRCFECHGPDEHERKAGLRLDLAQGEHGAYRTRKGRTAIQPGSVEESELWHRVVSENPDERMPPPESKKPALSEAERTLVNAWIEAGAPYDEFWAFVPPQAPASLPEASRPDWNRHPIDRLVHGHLQSKGLTPHPRADRPTLIRRVTFDLTGLPPTRDEIRSFLNDAEPAAYERLVDRLLDSRHFGEHLAKYWLDLVRFADTNGIHHDHYRDLTPYRDWVIRAFNANLPYDDFIRFQLAGDLYEEPTRDQRIASGFHRLHLIIDVGTALPEESHVRNVIDRVTSVGTAFMGLTVQCAVCHDHKYDPITAKDFYQLYAFFNNIDAEPETGRRNGSDFIRGLQPPYINLTRLDQETRLQALNEAVRQAEKTHREAEQRLEQAAAETESARRALTDKLKQAKAALEQARKQKDDYETTIPAAMVMRERADIRPAHILIRGAYDQPGEEIQRGTPGFLPPLRKQGDTASRRDLAEWLVSPENPLTARIAVNRFWQHCFGVGIVKTSEDFGSQGEWPHHPELLDHLAVTFRDSGWDVKGLLRHIVLSETYRQTSEATPEEFARDPENRDLARGSRFRMDSEMIRDQILATSGLLNTEMFGKSVKPPQPPGLWKSIGMPSSYPKAYEPDAGEEIYRRSVYTFWKRGMPPPQMTILNAPSREACTARRERTNTPLQALLLLNEQEYLKAARRLASRTLEITHPNPKYDVDRLHVLYETITSHQPDAGEEKALLTALEDLKAHYRKHSELARELCQGIEMEDPERASTLAAWTMLTSTLYNLDITKTRQ